MKIVRFKGKFKDLIPDGWTFQKLFARNYRQYHKTCDGKPYSHGCRIWQHLGGYLEIGGLDSDFSADLVQKIIDGTIHEWSSEVRKLGKPDQKEIVYWFLTDEEERRFIPRSSPEYNRIKRLKFDLDPETNKEEFHKVFDRYREWNARPELIDMLKNLVKRGWITVEEK